MNKNTKIMVLAVLFMLRHLHSADYSNNPELAEIHQNFCARAFASVDVALEKLKELEELDQKRTVILFMVNNSPGELYSCNRDGGNLELLGSFISTAYPERPSISYFISGPNGEKRYENSIRRCSNGVIQSSGISRYTEHGEDYEFLGISYFLTPDSK